MLENFQEGKTFALKRQELLSQTDGDFDETERAMAGFLGTLAADSFIVGVAISRIRLGGIYTDFFIRDFKDKVAMRGALRVTGESYKLLAQATEDEAGYGSFINLGGLTFEEVEKLYRERWETGDPNSPLSPFGQFPRSGEMELLGIVKFED